jgi:hypothetical protein
MNAIIFLGKYIFSNFTIIVIDKTLAVQKNLVNYNSAKIPSRLLFSDEIGL